MLKYVTIVLLLTVAVVNGGSFVFPDEVSSKSWSGAGYDDGDYGNSDSYENHQFDHEQAHHPEYIGNYHGNNAGFASEFGNHHGYNNERDRPWRRPNYSGIVSQSQANSQSSGVGSSANSQSGSQGYNEFSQSNAQAQSQGYQQLPSYSTGPNGVSSAASATSGIVNGIPVASASASAAASTSGGTASASSSSSSSGGFRPAGHGQFSPWFIGSRSAGDNSNESANRNDDSSSLNADSIIFNRK